MHPVTIWSDRGTFGEKLEADLEGHFRHRVALAFRQLCRDGGRVSIALVRPTSMRDALRRCHTRLPARPRVFCLAGRHERTTRVDGSQLAEIAAEVRSRTTPDVGPNARRTL